VILATVLTLVGVALFVRLGTWQMHRADEKRALIEQFEAGRQSTLTLTNENADAFPRYQHVRARGRFDGAHQVLLDNMPSQHGRPGYHVLTPFELTDGGWVLVDRGWIPMGATRADIPDVDVGVEPRELLGQLDDLPRAGIALEAPSIEPAAPWPRVMSFPPRATLEQALGRKLPERLVLLDAAQPDGYERVWHARFAFGPERHLAYAVQWFALAAAAAAIYLFLMFRRKHKTHDVSD
jgi:surfeit locus 1 family protein